MVRMVSNIFPRKRCVIIGVLFLVFFFLLKSFVLYPECNYPGIRRAETENQTKHEFTINNQRQKIAKLEHENAMLREKLVLLNQGHDTKKDDESQMEVEKAKQFTSSLPRPNWHKLANDASKFSELVTIILYHQNQAGSSCLETKEKSMREKFPAIEILRTEKAATVGSTFNELFPQVITKYFLFYDAQLEMFDQASDYSSGWLLHALENVPELDFVSGSTLNPKDQLEIPCYRMSICNWTLTERYEFERSVDELMICENIAPTFMGRTSAVKRLQLDFDEKLPMLAQTDFFLRAKKVGAVSGVRPEVMFKVNNNTCIGPPKTRRQYYQDHLPFAYKHKVFRLKDFDSNVFDICGSDSPILGEDICDDVVAHQVMLHTKHWAYSGAFAYPYIVRNLQNCLFEVTDLLNSKGLVYSIEAGVSLGAVKLRGVLPWDAGDVDMYVYGFKNPAELYPLIRDFAREKNYFATDKVSSSQVQLYCVSEKIGVKMGGLVSLFVRDSKPPEFIQLKTNGRWIPYRKGIFRALRVHYKDDYLRHRMYQSKIITRCSYKGHNACLPDFRDLHNGTGGTFSEYFCQM